MERRMKDIQIAMGAVESLNERIYNLQEDLKELESQKTALITQKPVKKVKKIFFSTLGAVFLIIALVCFVLFIGLVCEGEGVAIVYITLMIIFGVFAFACLSSELSDQENDKLERLEKGISLKRIVLSEYKEKKRELILENEKKLNDALKEKNTAKFPFENIAEDKECPMCAETVKAKACICRYCGHKFD